MIKKCKVCKKEFTGRPNQDYCSRKCRKAQEVLLRRAPKPPAKTPKSGKKKPPTNKGSDIPSNITKPDNLNPIASAYWDKVSPILIKRGHLNVLSEDAFAELCDLHSRVVDIRKMIDSGTVVQCEECGAEVTMPGNRSLLQLDDKWSVNDGIQTQTFKESALSDLKRKYSARFLDYCKQFYLTPAANRGNFNLEEDESEDEKAKGKERFF
ncbi:MAG: Phage terminase, small subunit [Syntrophorhabdus sp. PtaU1.Bin153]|nr:MAG: Phage terminase, small subunit [Syntrophorhabdus sp. PtaU1.Bin153]